MAGAIIALRPATSLSSVLCLATRININASTPAYGLGSLPNPAAPALHTHWCVVVWCVVSAFWAFHATRFARIFAATRLLGLGMTRRCRCRVQL